MFHSVSSQDFSRDLLSDEVGDVVLAIGTQMVPLYNVCCLSWIEGKGTRTRNIHPTTHGKIHGIRACSRYVVFLGSSTEGRVFYNDVEPLSHVVLFDHGVPLRTPYSGYGTTPQVAGPQGRLGGALGGSSVDIGVST